jgi:Fe-S-cluster containining protein
MREIIHSFLSKGEKPPADVVKGKYYTRTGSCNQCGKCCKDIYLIHEDKTIDSLELFEELKPANPEYQHFVVVGETEHGLQFQCKHLSPENRCAIYENRPDFCRKYPSEKSILLGGSLAKGCGYKFELIRTFEDVLSQVAQKPHLSAGRLEA